MTTSSSPRTGLCNRGKPEVFDLTSDLSSKDESGLPYKQLGEDRERNFLYEMEEKVDQLLTEALHTSSNFFPPNFYESAGSHVTELIQFWFGEPFTEQAYDAFSSVDLIETSTYE